ncbi:MAG: hypothetical protein Kow0025_15950 [Thermodesulfovibrionales bacterium]
MSSRGRLGVPGLFIRKEGRPPAFDALSLRKSDYILIIGLLAMVVFLGLYLYRHLDDNRLTGWRWVFKTARPAYTFVALGASVAAAWLLSRLRMPGPGLLFVIAFGFSALFWREPEVLVDASRYFTQAKHLELYGAGYFLREWGGEVAPWTDMPLVPFLYGLAYKVFGEARVVTQALVSAMFALTAAVSYLLGRDLWDEDVGQSAGALMLAMPFLYSQVPLLLVDVPAMFFLAVSVFAFNRALERGGAGYAGLTALAVFASVFSKYSLWLMLTVLGIVFLVRLPRAPWTVLRRAASALALSGALSGAFAAYKYGTIREQMELLMAFQKPALKGWSESYVSTFLYQVHPFVTAGAVFSVVAAVRRKDPRYLIAAWLLVLMFALEIKRSRYVIPLFPMLALLSAYGLREIREVQIRRFVVAVSVLMSVSLAFFAYLPYLDSLSAVNLKRAGRYLDAQAPGEVMVFTTPQRSTVNPAVAVPILDLFTKKRISYGYEPANVPGEESLRLAPLRFTWEYDNPRYYEPRGEGPWPLVAVISARASDPLPEALARDIGSYNLLETFGAATDIFSYKTVVRVYGRR